MSRFKKRSVAFQLMAKPAGPKCNLNCDYCFYLEKEVFYKGKKTIMSDQVLEAYIKKYIESQEFPEVEFVWQGGEPALAGLDFYKRAVEMQKEYANGRIIRNSFQTNGLLLNEKWCEFFANNDFLIGISLDGPKEIHDLYRKDIRGNSTFDSVMKSIKLMQNYGVEFNAMACVAKATVKKPIDIYRFFKENGINFIQFTPIVERIPDSKDSDCNLKLGSPSYSNCSLTEWSVDGGDYGDFLIKIFDEWIRNDVGATHIMNFEWALASWMNLPSTLCVFSKRCGCSLIIEHTGDIYSCDHFMYPEYLLGNIHDLDLLSTVKSKQQLCFGKEKENIPEYCKNCNVLFACRGGCPKHRFIKTDSGSSRLNYLCESYKKFFNHAYKYLSEIADLIETGRPASDIMKRI